MIPRSGPQIVRRNSLADNDLQLGGARSSGSADPARTLSLQPSPAGSGGPLLTLHPPDAAPAQAAGHVEAPPIRGRLAHARDLISDFVTTTRRLVPGSDRTKYLAVEAARLEKSLNEAIASGKSHAELAQLAETAVKVHYELSQCKGTPKDAELSLLKKCLDMYDGVAQIVTAEKLHLKRFTWDIASKAYALQVNLSTGMNVRDRGFGVTVLEGARPTASKVDLLGWARAASLYRRAAYAQEPPGLDTLFNDAQQLRNMPMGNPIDGNRLTREEINLLCANPPQNPWPVEPRLQRFYDAARLAAHEVRAAEKNAMRRERLAVDMPPNPDPELAKRNDPIAVADLIAGYASDVPGDPG